MYRKPAKHSFKRFAEDIKSGKTGNVIMMYGAEQYLVKWAVNTIVKKYVNPATRAMDYQVLDEENSSVSKIIEAAETFSMFSQKRVVYVRQFRPLTSDYPPGYPKDEIAKLSDYLKKCNENTILIFSGEEIKEKAVIPSVISKCGKSYDFSKIDRPDFISFAKKRFRNAGIDISSSAMNYLVECTGYFNKESDYRLYNFENDIFKIIAHSNGKTVTEKDIDETVAGDMETFVFDMLDGISANRKDRAFEILYNMLSSGSDAFSIIGAIVSQFELMLSVKQLREDSVSLADMHKKLGGSEYRIKKMIPYANRFSQDKLKHILSSIYETDRNIKTGILDSRTALEIFIAGI